MRLAFFGAAMMVTGSCYLLEVGGRKVLIDCGMFQGSKLISSLNRRPFPYNPAEIDCVFLTHAHIDHSGLLPKLCKSGFNGPVYSTKVTRELCGIMLPDSAHIQEFDAEIANRKGQRAGKQHVEPLYTVDDAYRCLKQFVPVPYDETLTIEPHIAVRFRDAGHILGSSIIEVNITEQNKNVKLVFSGDLGQPNQPIIKDPTIIEDADYVIMESTYGNRKHEANHNADMLAQIINDSVEAGGNVIIPAFAVGRTQTILYHLNKLFRAGSIPDIPVIIDSPLAISATDIFIHNPQEYDSEASEIVKNAKDHPLKMPQLVFTKTSEESKAINHMDRPAIIISASGMADAGRILHHLKHNLWRPEASVLLVGYQAQGSLGRRLQEGVKRVKIMGENISVKAKIYNMDGFSAHADKDQLLTWLSSFKKKPNNIFLVHGEQDMIEPLAQSIKELQNIPTYIPRYGDAAVIDGSQWFIEESTLDVPAEQPLRQLREYLAQLENTYNENRRHLEQIVSRDASRAPELINRLERIRQFIEKTLRDI